MPFRTQVLQSLLSNLSARDAADALRGRSLPERLTHRRDMRPGPRGHDRPREAAAHILGPNVIGRRVFLVAEPSSPIHDHIGWLDRYTRGVTSCATLDEVADATHVAPHEGIMLVSLDMCFNLSVAFDMLAAYRQSAPERVVVIASQMFVQHDLSCARAGIADASIRLPASRAELALCLSAAVTNNGYGRTRLQMV